MGVEPHPTPATKGTANKRFTANVLHPLMLQTLCLAMAGFVCCATIGLGRASSRGRTPQFALRHSLARPDSGIVIVARNRAARRNQPLNIEYEGLKLQTAAPLWSKENSEFRWHFKPVELHVPAALLRDGVHELRVCHPGEAWSKPMQVVWHTQPPVVTAEAVKISGSEKVVIAGRVATKMPLEDYQIAVEVRLHVAPEAISITLPVQRGADSAGVAIFTFRMAVQGLPNILPGEIGFAQPFFALLVTDPAGNSFYQEESYAWFTAPGHKRLGRKPADAQDPQGALALPTGRRESVFNLAARVPNAHAHPARTTHADLRLEVEKTSPQLQHLRWTSGAKPAHDGQALALVWRDEQPVAICFTHHYRDEEAPLGKGCGYRVEQITRDGRVLGSNVVQVEGTPGAAKAAAEAQPLLMQTFGPSEAAASTEPINLRDQTAIAAVVGRHKSTIQDCYQRGLRHDQSLKGKVVVRFVVTPQGAVSNAEVVSSTLRNDRVEDCMLNRIKRWNDFGAAPKQGEVAFKQTYLFGY